MIDVAAPGRQKWDIAVSVDGARVIEATGVRQLAGFLPFEGIDVGIDRRSPVSWDLFTRRGPFRTRAYSQGLRTRPGLMRPTPRESSFRNSANSVWPWSSDYPRQTVCVARAARSFRVLAAHVGVESGVGREVGDGQSSVGSPVRDVSGRVELRNLRVHLGDGRATKSFLNDRGSRWCRRRLDRQRCPCCVCRGWHRMHSRCIEWRDCQSARCRSCRVRRARLRRD